jgi:hypothetical protein
MGLKFICNIQDLKACFNQFKDKENVNISHCINGRFVKCSKKSIINMAYSMDLDNPLGLTDFKAKFVGREATAIGKFYKITFKAKADNVDSFIELLYIKYSHLQDLHLFRNNTPAKNTFNPFKN